MHALVFENSLPRLAATRLLGSATRRAYVGRLAPLRLREIAEPRLPADDWVVVRTRLCGICGSDCKQVFMKGRFDNPMTALLSWPQVPGHEVAGTVESLGPAVTRLREGQRVVLDPWLSCVRRGLEPCEWCREGAFAQCLGFRRGRVAPGLHTGTSATATGGFAPRLPAHESMCIPVPDDVGDEVAVLADPFSVSLHAVLRHPPPAGGRALVYGCGTLGLLAVAILEALHPDVQVLAVARHPHQADLAERLGAETVVPGRDAAAVLEAVTEATGAEPARPWRGLPMLNGGVDVVYDTVSSAATFEVGVRATRSRGRIVTIGLEVPRRFEWTPLYFKEIALVGSNAFGIEELDGRRQHAMEWFFELARMRRLPLAPLVTHRFPLTRYRDAFLTCVDRGGSGAVKVVFDRFD